MVHPLKSGKPFIPLCQLNYRNKGDLKDALVTYMRQYCGKQAVGIDTDTRQILVDGEPRYRYELIPPVPAKTPVRKMF